MATERQLADTVYHPRRVRLTVLGLCGVMLFGAIFVTRSYLERNRFEAENARPYHHARLEQDLEAVNRDGESVSLGQLRDHIWVATSIYTDCPGICSDNAARMASLIDDFGGAERFRMVSFSIDPETDTPEVLDRWLKEHGRDWPGWWCLSGEEERVRKYLTGQFRFRGVSLIEDSQDDGQGARFIHDERLALVDGRANVRGYYRFDDPERAEAELARLRRDITFLLRELAGEADSLQDLVPGEAVGTGDET